MSQRVVKVPEGDPPPAGALQQAGYEDDGQGTRFAIYLVDDTNTASTSATGTASTWVCRGGETIADILQSAANDEFPDQQNVA